MSLQLTHQEIEELLGAFAMDAVEGGEAEAIELHLRTCPQCRAEVTEHREVAALLAHTGAPAPDGVWSRILEELEPAPPALRMPGLPTPPPTGAATFATTPTDRDDGIPHIAATAPSSGPPSTPDAVSGEATVTSLSSRRATVRMRTMVAVVSAAAVIVSILGVVTLNQSHRLDRMDASLREVSVDRIATDALSDPQAASGKLVSLDKQVNAPVVVNAKGMGYLFTSKLPELPKTRTYQLWAQVNGSTLSLGVFDGGAEVVQFQLGDTQREAVGRLMVTEENAPGVTVSKHQALLSGTV